MDGFALGLSLGPDRIKNQNQTIGKHSHKQACPDPGSLSLLRLSTHPGLPCLCLVASDLLNSKYVKELQKYMKEFQVWDTKKSIFFFLL